MNIYDIKNRGLRRAVLVLAVPLAGCLLTLLIAFNNVVDMGKEVKKEVFTLVQNARHAWNYA